MCRLLYVPQHSGISNEVLRGLMKKLEKDQGGHGNGLALIKGCELLHDKGIKLTVKECADYIIEGLKDGYDALWHTRWCTSGAQCDELCHPFAIDGSKFQGVIAHNGHWSYGAQHADYLEKTTKEVWSDSKVGAYLIGKHGLYWMAKHMDIPGVWMALSSGKRQVCKGSGSLEYDPETFVWCSSLPMTHFPKSYFVGMGIHNMNKPAPRSVVAPEFHGTYAGASYSATAGRWRYTWDKEKHLGEWVAVGGREQDIIDTVSAREETAIADAAAAYEERA